MNNKVVLLRSADEGSFRRLKLPVCGIKRRLKRLLLTMREVEIAVISLDYFKGCLRLLVWLPGDEEPSRKITIKNFAPICEG